MKVLVVAAHPDDEVLGCGGTVARHSADGDEIRILILGEGVTSRDERRDPATRDAELREILDAAVAASRALGVSEPPVMVGLPDQRLDDMPLIDVVKHVERAIKEFGPEVVYTHHGGDLNADHRIVHQAVLTASRPVPGAGIRSICAWETLSSTEWNGPAVGPPFVPTRYVTLSPADLDAKLAALNAYAAEMRPFPHPRSAEAVSALARVRGSQVGVERAEAFIVVREIT